MADRAEYWDVLQEQPDPWAVLNEWLRADPETLVFDAKVRRHGPSVLDPDRSYCVYKGPGIITPYFVLNLWELLAALAHPRYARQEIRVTTRPHPLPTGFKMLPLPWAEVELAVVVVTRGARAAGLTITLNGAPVPTGAEGRPWW